MKYFISCTKKDVEIADVMMSFLNRACGIEYKEMYNCYVGENTIPVGKDYNEYIRGAIANSEVVILLISQDSLASKYCLCELGAAWALDKKAVMIFVEPANYDELMDTPMMGIQAWSVNLRQKDSIHELLQNAQTEFSAMPQNASRTQYGIIENKATDDLYRIGFVQEKPIAPSLQSCSAFHENGDPSTLRLRNVSNESVTARIDFDNSKPQFVGFFANLRNSDWSGIMLNDYSMCFSAAATATINKVTIEFKNKHSGEQLHKFGSKEITLRGGQENNYAIKLKEISDVEEDWTDMKELVFLFHAEDVDTVGDFTLKDLRFER